MKFRLYVQCINSVLKRVCPPFLAKSRGHNQPPQREREKERSFYVNFSLDRLLHRWGGDFDRTTELVEKSRRQK